jgi:hypothetical protein
MPRESDSTKSMPGPKTGGTTQITVRLPPDLLRAVDAWIARHPEGKMTRPEAVRQILSGALASHRPSTILPNFTTGRDIV